jgi:hypothetical protein
MIVTIGFLVDQNPSAKDTPKNSFSIDGMTVEGGP